MSRYFSSIADELEKWYRAPRLGSLSQVPPTQELISPSQITSLSPIPKTLMRLMMFSSRCGLNVSICLRTSAGSALTCTTYQQAEKQVCIRMSPPQSDAVWESVSFSGRHISGTKGHLTVLLAARGLTQREYYLQIHMNPYLSFKSPSNSPSERGSQ